MAVGIGVGIGTGIGVDVGTGVGAGIGVGGTAAIVAAIPASIVASMSGVALGAAVGSACATAVWTAASMSWVGGGLSTPREHPASATTRISAATLTTLIGLPYPHPPPRSTFHPPSIPTPRDESTASLLHSPWPRHSHSSLAFPLGKDISKMRCIFDMSIKQDGWVRLILFPGG